MPGFFLGVIQHNDSGQEEGCEFDGSKVFNLAVMDGEYIVMIFITTNDVTTAAMNGSLTLGDPALAGNTITVENVSLDMAGWIV